MRVARSAALASRLLRGVVSSQTSTLTLHSCPQCDWYVRAPVRQRMEPGASLWTGRGWTSVESHNDSDSASALTPFARLVVQR
jgi:hypothetical protein